MDISKGMHGVRLRIRIDVWHGHVVKKDFNISHDRLRSEIKSVIWSNRLRGDVNQSQQRRDRHGHHKNDRFHV